MKEIIQFLTNLIQEGNAIRITTKKTGVTLRNPKPFVVEELAALATKQGFQSAHFKPSIRDGELIPPSVWVGVGTPPSTNAELVSFLESVKE